MVTFERFAHSVHFGDSVMSAAIAPDPEWVDARKAAKILGVPGARNVNLLASRGLITTRDLPGVRARFLLADVERLVADGTMRKEKVGLNYLFDVRPEPGADERLFLALAKYKAARDPHRRGGVLAKNEEPVLDFGAAFEFLICLGDLALRQVNRAMDEDFDAFVVALEGPGWDEVDEGFDGFATRLWETLARLQAEGPTGTAAAADVAGVQPRPGAGTATVAGS